MPADCFQRLRGKFIVFDGVDGAGKGAQLERLKAELKSRNLGAIRTRDPGGTVIGDRIRHVLLDYDLSKMDPSCETFLFMASRAQLVREVIRPALAAGKTCLGDRYVSATCAYQGAAGYDPRRVVELAKFAIGDAWPDLTIVIDLSPKEGFKRTARHTHAERKGAGHEGQTMLFHDVHTDAMEARPLEFHERVRQIFLDLPTFYPAPVEIIDGHGSEDAVQARVMEVLARAAL